MWTLKKDIFKTDDTKPTIPCGESISAAGVAGIYELTVQLGTAKGITGFVVNSQSVPDRFEIEYNGNIVADTKYIGDAIEYGPPIFYPLLLGNRNLPVYEFNGNDFSSTGEIRNIMVTQEDISNNITEATDGNTFIYFNKTTEYPTEAKLIVTGSGNTGWDISEFVCPLNITSLPNGSEKVFYGFLPFSEKSNKFMDNGFGSIYCISKKLFINSSQGRVYKDVRGIPDLFSGNSFNDWTSTNKYINDGTTWFELDENGFVIATGLI